MGNIIVRLAKNNDDVKIAHQLVKLKYDEKLYVNFEQLSKLHPEHFESDVLLAFTADDMELVGTMSVMYPNSEEMYPCESFFGFDLHSRRLADRNYVEIGRFATKQAERCDRKIVIALFLGAIKHLQNKQIVGWTAIVKENIFNFLSKISLPMNIINQKPKLPDKHPLHVYATDIHLFDVSLAETVPSFQRFVRFEQSGHIKLCV